ncbi:ferritin-like domain-containing protein [Erythrobacter litoralis]|uniref:Uncharacterized protein n=1 Tax=Erythrobacter litoralis (strain HTCC2594) TaxID=314225 RepID=Q2N5V6_ERYLH|nr:ferritin-like domain-containing protein [Erythrobacter litoralis]ABC64935.1 hypothetical protein ELI_14215 [Erythrobacter litoralis HTCC2594]
MATADLEYLYAALLQDMVSADEQSLALTERLRDAATSEDLRDALEDGVCGIGDGLEIARKLAEAHPADDGEFQSDGMAGLVTDTQERVFETDFASGSARDAAILAQYMHLTYYGLAGYRTLAAIASQLGHADEAEDLQTCYENAQDGQDDMIGLLDGEVLEDTA